MAADSDLHAWLARSVLAGQWATGPLHPETQDWATGPVQAHKSHGYPAFPSTGNAEDTDRNMPIWRQEFIYT